MTEYEFHELANIFPLIEGREFDELVNDIREIGQREPIVLFDGKILDGRNRYRACKVAGVPIRSTAYSGDDPVRYVISLNLRRRHLDETQRGMAAARLANIVNGGDRRSTEFQSAHVRSVSQSSAAELLNVSRRTVQNAAAVLQHGVEALQRAVDAGEVSARAAAEVASLPQSEQTEIAAAGADAIRDAAKKVRGNICTGKNDWYTPDTYIEAARSVMGAIDLDPATCAFAQQTVKAAEFFTKEDDGLAVDWFGRVWLNPPYSQPHIMQFVSKLAEEVDASNVEQAILLTHSHTDTSWFHRAVRACSAICFTRGRVKFYDENGVANAPPEGHAFLYFGQNTDRFSGVFSKFGFIAKPIALHAGAEK